MEINEGWSKNGVSHARISAHVLHIVLYPAAADPSPLKRDGCVCVRRACGSKRMEREERNEEGMKEAERKGRRETEEAEKSEVKQMGVGGRVQHRTGAGSRGRGSRREGRAEVGGC